jgi:hypothetical protein
MLQPLDKYLPEIQTVLPRAFVSSGGTNITCYIGCWTIECTPWLTGVNDDAVCWTVLLQSSLIHRRANGDTALEALRDGLGILDRLAENIPKAIKELSSLPRK